MSCFTEPSSQDPLLDQSLTSPYLDRASSALVNLHVHLLQRNDGSGGLTAGAVSDLLAQLATDFAPVGVYFHLVGESAIQHTTWFDDPLAHADTLMAISDGAETLDIVLGPATGAVAGKAVGIPGTVLILTGAADGTQALSHLVGHCLGLYDTDETSFGVELPDGSNKTVAGDLVADTAADPGLSGYVEASCELSAQFSLDHPEHEPDPGNIMSSGRMSCWVGFSPEQGARMLAVLEHVPAIQALRTPPAVIYTDRSSLTGLEYPGQPLGAAAVDYNNDGKKDLLISRESHAAMAWLCLDYDATTGTPAFTETTGDAFSPSAPPSGTLGFILADYDNDGWTDFFAPNPGPLTTQYARLYRNIEGVFTDMTSAVGLPQGHVVAASWADYDRDGDVDLLLVFGIEPVFGLDGDLGLFRNDVADTGEFQDVTQASGITSTLGWHAPYLSPLWADLDGNGYLDLLLLDADSPVPGPPVDSFTRYLANNGDGTFTDVTTTRIDAPEALLFSTIAALADVDNDGELDVVVSTMHIGGQAQVAYLINDGGFLTYAPQHQRPSGHHTTEDLAILDFDLDGNMDVLLSHWDTWSGTSARPLLLANRQGVLVDESSLAGLSQTGRLHGFGLADYNLDGFTDLYLTRTDAGHFFYKASPNSVSQHRWTGVRLVSPFGANNRLGIGATVTIEAGSHTQIQIVDGGSGRASQREPDLVFGLGDYAGSVSATVRWPTGRIQPVNLQLDQYNLIEDDSPLIDESSVTAYLVYHVQTGTQDWVFEWTTNYAVDASLDKVIIVTDNLPSQCVPPETVLTPGMGGVDHDVELQVDGTYLHRLTWINVPCVARCNIPYQVQSGIDQFTSTSKNNHKLNIPTCPQSL